MTWPASRKVLPIRHGFGSSNVLCRTSRAWLTKSPPSVISPSRQVSEHLRILRSAGILVVQKDGRKRLHYLRRCVLRQFEESVEVVADERWHIRNRMTAAG